MKYRRACIARALRDAIMYVDFIVSRHVSFPLLLSQDINIHLSYHKKKKVNTNNGIHKKSWSWLQAGFKRIRKFERIESLKVFDYDRIFIAQNRLAMLKSLDKTSRPFHISSRIPRTSRTFAAVLDPNEGRSERSTTDLRRIKWAGGA